MLGHKFRILEILVTKYPILYVIETIVLPVCPGADTQSQTPICSTRFLLLDLGPSSIHKTISRFISAGPLAMTDFHLYI